MCEKAVNTYLSTINIVSECFMTQEMCDKAVNIFFFFFFLFSSVPDQYKTQEICDRAIPDFFFFFF